MIKLIYLEIVLQNQSLITKVGLAQVLTLKAVSKAEGLTLTLTKVVVYILRTPNKNHLRSHTRSYG